MALSVMSICSFLFALHCELREVITETETIVHIHEKEVKDRGRLIVIDVNTKKELSNTELSQSSSVISAIQPTRLNIKDSLYSIHLTEYDTEKNTMTLYVYLDTYK
jgi:hypothetical protein